MGYFRRLYGQAVVFCCRIESGPRLVVCSGAFCRGLRGSFPVEMDAATAFVRVAAAAGRTGISGGSGVFAWAGVPRSGKPLSGVVEGRVDQRAHPLGMAFERRAQRQRHHHGHRQTHARLHLRGSPDEVMLKSEASVQAAVDPL